MEYFYWRSSLAEMPTETKISLTVPGGITATMIATLHGEAGAGARRELM
jgi:hypothetical protein